MGRYNKLTGKTSNEVEEYYKRWLVPDQCLGGCGDHAVCMDGVCVCDGENEYVQLFGRCLSNSTAFLKQGKERHTCLGARGLLILMSLMRQAWSVGEVTTYSVKYLIPTCSVHQRGGVSAGRTWLSIGGRWSVSCCWMLTAPRRLDMTL